MDEQTLRGEQDLRQGILGTVSRAASTWVGAVISLALMAGVAVWFYRLGTRDASEIPVISAAVGPTKERPKDPGGAIAPHQAMASYTVLEDGTVPNVAPPPDPAVADAPPVPEAGDGPMVAELPPARPPVPETPPEAVETGPGPAEPPEAAPVETPVETPSVVEAPVEVPEPPVAPEPTPEPVELVETPAEAGPAPVSSPVAPRRPRDLVALSEAARREAPRTAAAEAQALAQRAAESRVQIQLGAFESPDVTQVMWTSIQRAHSDVLAGRALAIQSVVSGGRTLYRLRVGPFETRNEAQNVCAALEARGQNCIVAANR